MSYQTVRNCKTPEEAIAASDYFLGQRAKVVGLMVSGNLNGEWTVMPEFEISQSKDRHRLLQSQGIEE